MLAPDLLAGQRGLDGVVHIVAVDELVYAHALLTDSVEESRRIPANYLADGGVTEHGVQAANDGNQFFRGAAAAGTLYGFDGVANAVCTVTDGVGKVAVEKQELENAIGRELGGVDLAIGFKRRTAAKQPYQFKVLIA